MTRAPTTERSDDGPVAPIILGPTNPEESFYFPPVQGRVPTPRQGEVLRAIHSCFAARGHSPSYRELCAALGVTSTNGIAEHLRSLERWGWVTRGEHATARALSLTEDGLAAIGATRCPLPVPRASRPESSLRDGPSWVHGSVYFIEAEGADRVKIGFTGGDVDERRRQIQVGCPFTLVTLAFFAGTMRDESRLHARFGASRCASGNEWFLAGPALRTLIRDVGRAEPRKARRVAMGAA